MRVDPNSPAARSTRRFAPRGQARADGGVAVAREPEVRRARVPEGTWPGLDVAVLRQEAVDPIEPPSVDVEPPLEHGLADERTDPPLLGRARMTRELSEGSAKGRIDAFAAAHQSMRPSLIADATAAALLHTPSFEWMCWKWVLIVPTLTYSSSAMSRTDRPSAASWRTSSSRRVSGHASVRPFAPSCSGLATIRCSPASNSLQARNSTRL